VGPSRLHDADSLDDLGQARGVRHGAAVRENILARTRAIIRANLPQVEAWIRQRRDVFSHARPVAGAIAYVKYDLPVGSTELLDRVREERSVLLVPGDMFGLGKGIRFGFGYDIEHTMKGLAWAEDLITGRAS
jgi:aspartate/methionine/tyrosine aminotransferase